MTLPLEGVKVLDLCRLLVGDWCTQMLADFGADVLKIEPPGTGDYARWARPLYKNESVYFCNVNRNKRSMILNLKMPEGREILYKLTEGADVLVETYRPGVPEKLGFDYKTLSKINPRLLYCAITGFGQTGPWSRRAGHDINIDGVSGLLGIEIEGMDHPMMPHLQMADYAGALMGTIAIPIALLAREKTGRGQFIDANMLDGLLSWLTPGATSFFAQGRSSDPRPIQSWGRNPRYNIYKCKDGKHLTLSVLETHFWANLCHFLGREDLIDPNESPVDRITDHGAKRVVYKKFLTNIFLTKNRDEWVKELQAHDVPCLPVYSVEEALTNDHAKAREMVFEIDHPAEGRIPQLGFPIKMSDTPAQYLSPPPLFGQHTTDVLLSLGYSNEQIDRWRQKGVIDGAGLEGAGEEAAEEAPGIP